jgi:hypothetical protein
MKAMKRFLLHPKLDLAPRGFATVAQEENQRLILASLRS